MADTKQQIKPEIECCDIVRDIDEFWVLLRKIRLKMKRERIIKFIESKRAFVKEHFIPLVKRIGIKTNRLVNELITEQVKGVRELRLIK